MSRRIFSRELFEVRSEIETEAPRARRFAERQLDDARERWCAERVNVLGDELERALRGEVADRPRLFTGPRRAHRLVDDDRRRAERPEIEVEGIDRIHPE